MLAPPLAYKSRRLHLHSPPSLAELAKARSTPFLPHSLTLIVFFPSGDHHRRCPLQKPRVGQIDITTSFTEYHSTFQAPQTSLTPSSPSQHHAVTSVVPHFRYRPLLKHHRPSQALACLPRTLCTLPVPQTRPKPSLCEYSVLTATPSNFDMPPQHLHRALLIILVCFSTQSESKSH